MKELINWNDIYYTGLNFVHETDESKYPNINELFLDWFFIDALKNIDIAKGHLMNMLRFKYVLCIIRNMFIKFK